MEYLQISSIFSEKETTTNNKKQQKAFIDSNIAYYIITVSYTHLTLPTIYSV